MKKYTYRILSLLVTVMFFSSCLKDDRMVLNPENTHNVVEFANPGERALVGSVYPLYPLLVDLEPEVSLPVTVSYSGPEAVAPQDIVVKIGLASEQVIVDYNDAEDTDFSMMPSNVYSLSATEVTIPKGQSKATIMVNYKANQFSFTDPYVLPLEIQSASYGTVSGNYNIILLQVGPKNEYHGTYRYTYNTSLGANLSGKNVSMVTAGPNTLKLLPGLISVYSNYVDYTIDPVTNKITVNMTTLLPIATDPSSEYDPETKTLNVKWTSNGGSRTFIEKFVKID